MPADKVLAIFEQAFEKTFDGTLNWQPSQQAGVFEFATPSGFLLKLFPHTDYTGSVGEGPPSLTLYDSGQQMIFDITDSVDGVTPDKLEELYDAARITALGIQDKLDAILEDLTDNMQNPTSTK